VRTPASTVAAFYAPGTGLASTNYNYILAGANDTANRLVVFVNGSTRTDDGGVSNVTIRNDAGSLILGNPSFPTIVRGKVGIGTSSPNAPLNVYGSGPFSGLTANPQPGQLIINTTTGSERLILGAWYTGGVGSQCSIQSSDYFDSVDHGQALSLNPLGGNVGIGTTSPLEKLDIRGGSISMGEYSTSTGSRYVGFGYNDGSSYRCIAGMEIENTTLGGNYSQKLHFRTHAYGAYEGRSMTITENGQVTIPRQPAFSAYRDAGILSASLVIFNIVQTNIGGHYNSSNGRFTAPVAGTYLFSVHTMKVTDANYIIFYIRKNGVIVTLGHGSADAYSHASARCITSMAANDYVDVYTQNQFYAGGGAYNNFNGHLIG
jgi:hypothetical protein